MGPMNGSSNELAPNRRVAIAWINAYQVHRHIEVCMCVQPAFSVINADNITRHAIVTFIIITPLIIAKYWDSTL